MMSPGGKSGRVRLRFVEADLAMKERALKTLQAPKSKHVRYCPPDAVLEFLQGL
jgi:integrase/recombinase XerD